MNKKLVLWFILVLALSYGVFQSINPFINPFIKQLFQADIRDEVKNPMNQLMDDLDRQVNKRETMSKKEIESINTDIEKISPNNEEESLYLELTKLILDFKAVDDADAAKLTIANNINYIDDAFTDETYKNLVLIKKYISSFEKRKKAIIEYNQAYLTNVERTLNKAEAKLPRKMFEEFFKGNELIHSKSNQMLNSGKNYYQVSIDFLKVIMYININSLFVVEDNIFYIEDDAYRDKFNKLVEKLNLSLTSYEKDKEEYFILLRQSSLKLKADI
jgi:hypothetical protein